MHLSGFGLFTELCNHHHSQSEKIFTHLPKEAVYPPISSHSPFPQPLEPQISLSLWIYQLIACEWKACLFAISLIPRHGLLCYPPKRDLGFEVYI